MLRLSCFILSAVCLSSCSTNVDSTPSPNPEPVLPSVSARGSATALDIATWNVERFGDTGGGPSNENRQLRNVAAILDQSDIELWALQEIQSASVLRTLMDALGDEWDSLLSQSSNAFTALVFRVGQIQAVRTESVVSGPADQVSYAFAGREPLAAELQISLADTTVSILAVTVHMKAFDDLESHARRELSASILKQELDRRFDRTPVVVMGDFNDELTQSITSGVDTPYRIFLDDAEHYRFLTEDLDRQGASTWCGSSSACDTGSTIDHILISDELFPSLVAGSTDRYSELLIQVERFTTTTSDHLPVVSRLMFDRNR